MPASTRRRSAQFDSRLKRYEDFASDRIQHALGQAAILHRPAPDWDLPCVGGGTVALRSLRGHIVVLDFWYKDCPWCLRAMPQIKALAADNKLHDVVVLGMNPLDNDKNIRLVIDKMQLLYDTLKASPELAKKYAVTAYPTLIIIDRQGVVRKIHEGAGPTLRQDVQAALDHLAHE